MHISPLHFIMSQFTLIFKRTELNVNNWHLEIANRIMGYLPMLCTCKTGTTNIGVTTVFTHIPNLFYRSMCLPKC